MIKVGKILGIMEILGGFFLIFLLLWIFCGEFLGALGVWGRWWGLALASFSECSECSECSDDKNVWGVGVGIFCWWFGFFL